MYLESWCRQSLHVVQSVFIVQNIYIHLSLSLSLCVCVCVWKGFVMLMGASEFC